MPLLLFFLLLSHIAAAKTGKNHGESSSPWNIAWADRCLPSTPPTCNYNNKNKLRELYECVLSTPAAAATSGQEDAVYADYGCLCAAYWNASHKVLWTESELPEKRGILLRFCCYFVIRLSFSGFSLCFLSFIFVLFFFVGNALLALPALKFLSLNIVERRESRKDWWWLRTVVAKAYRKYHRSKHWRAAIEQRTFASIFGFALLVLRFLLNYYVCEHKIFFILTF